MNLYIWQAKYLIAGLILLPLVPFLFLQGHMVRRRVGVLPDAGGETTGLAAGGDKEVRFLAIGESTVAGLGAATHEVALTGQFAKYLAAKIGRTVRWRAIGKNGVTARRTMELLVPKIPADEQYDYILMATCGNDVLKLSSPMKFRRDTLKLINYLRDRYPGVQLFITNAPVVRLSPALPNPIRWILGHLSQMHDENIREFTVPLKGVYYFHQPQTVSEGFFSDGIHPSEKGYNEWSDAMIRFFTEHYKW